MRRSLLALGVVAALLGSRATAQDKKPDSPGQEMPLPKPGPEHEVLKKEVGDWDVTVETWMEPKGKPEVTKGSETNRLIGGGLWLVQDFQGSIMGMPFPGHGVYGYDASKKKYVGTWVDSMSPGLSSTEGTYDAKARALTSWVEGPCPTGGMMKFRMTTEWKDDDHRITTMHSPQGQG